MPYTPSLKKFDSQLVAHQQGQLWYEEKIRFMKIDLDDKTDVLTYHKKLLAEAEKEKEDLKAKVEKWHNSSKNLNILLNSQMSARDKAGLGYGDQLNKGVLSYENEVFQSVFVSRTSETENSHVNDRYAEGMHAVPPPMTGIYIPSGPDKEIDDSQFSYGPKQSKPSESDARSSDFNSCESNCSEETHESMPVPVDNGPKVVNEPKVWSDAPIIEEYESDSEDEHVSLPTKEQEIPSFAFINTDKHVKTPRQTVIEQNTCSQSSKPDKKDCSGLMSKKLGLGFGYTKKACFVCGSFSHLIRDCDFHEKRMAKQAELNNRMSKGSSQREIRPVWNNVQRMNHQNQFVPKAVLTRTGKIPVNTARTSSTNTVNTARHNFNSQAVPINVARKVNTVKPIVNNARPKAGFHKSVSPFRKSFNRTTTLRTNFSKQKVNTAEDYPHRTFQNKGIVDSGCSRHMTGNKAYLAEYQDFNGGPVAFGGSKGYITGKGKIKTGKLDFEDVCFVKELQHFNLFSVSQMCDKKNKVLFTDTECLVLSPEFKLPDANQVLLRIPRQNNMYSFNLENIVPSGGLACLIAKATIDESNKWHRRLGHVNFKNLNKLVKGNLVRGLPSKIFQNDHTCVACQKGKQHKASCKAKSVSSISQPLQLLCIWICLVLHLTDSMIIKPVRSEKQANKHDSLQEANQKGSSKAGEEPTKHPDFQQVDKEDQVFLDKLERLKRQEQDANDVAEALRKEFAQETEDLLLQAGAAQASSTNIVNIASTPVSTASPYGGLFFTDPTNPDQDDSEIPALEEIYDNPTDGIFTNSSYDDEGAVVDFINLEPVVNVSPIPTSRINSIHPSTQILGDPQSAVQTRSKVTKSSGAHAFHWKINWLMQCKKTAAIQDSRKFKILIEAIRIFLAFASYMGFIFYQMDVSAFLYGKIDKEVYVSNLQLPEPWYLKGKPKLGLWYPRVSSFDLEAYSDSDYARANLDRKSTTGGCQFLGRRLISWQCKKQTIVATSTTEAEYVAAANCRGQVLWIQNQMLDYGFNFMNTKIYIDNESTICIVKNLVYHSKTKHIAIRHHFIKDAYEKKLIQVLKIHTNNNVVDLLTKAFDVSKVSILSCYIGVDHPIRISYGSQYDLLYSLYEVFSVQKNFDHSDDFHEVIWVLERHWKEI
ncbi:ribonuclease H-like domain-containing protein [Tanacetum coccineum]